MIVSKKSEVSFMSQNKDRNLKNSQQSIKPVKKDAPVPSDSFERFMATDPLTEGEEISSDKGK
jgi:reverse gyrase